MKDNGQCIGELMESVVNHSDWFFKGIMRILARKPINLN